MKKIQFSDKQKKVFNISITVVQIIAVLFAIIFAAIVLANPNVASAEVGGANVKLLPVLSNSMAGDKPDSFKEGDLIVAYTPKDKNALNVGDIVTFKMADENGRTILNTHRIIVKTTSSDGNTIYQTQGDATTKVDNFILADEVLAVYDYHIAGVGSAINWLQQPTNFLLVIVLPLIILFIYNIIMFIRMLMIAKLSKAVEGAGTAVVDEEEIKRKAIEEYLAKQSAEGVAVDTTHIAIAEENKAADEEEKK